MNTSSLTKDEIMKLIKNDDLSVTFVKPQPAPSQSAVWANSSYMYHNNHKQNFVSCDDCKEILVLNVKN
jgi:hypothetical protein